MRIKNIYEREIAKLPKGSLVKSTRKGHQYYYLVLREKGKVNLIYKGKLTDSEIKEYNKIKKLRSKYRHLLTDVKKQIKFLERSLKNER
ncbi:hypothetical protein ACFL4S_01380 [bacterium]